MLEVTIYTAESLDDEDVKPLVLDGVDFVSLINPGTHGPPALVAPNAKSGAPPTARPGSTVLFINTALVPVFEIERGPDS